MTKRGILSSLPEPKQEYTISFDDLSGGLNLYDLDSCLKSSESPEMKNLRWKDGALGCRKGQRWIIGTGERGTGFACWESLFHGRAFFHIGDGLYSCDPAADSPEYSLLKSGIPQNRGTFFRYGDCLMYKNRGAFLSIAFDGSSFTAGDVEPYTPVILINADPVTCAGDEYQPENRLSEKKTVWYSAKELECSAVFTGDGSTAEFSLGDSAAVSLGRVKYVKAGGKTVSTAEYTQSLEDGSITFTSPPENGTEIEICFTKNVRTYKLPAGDIQSVDSVEADGQTLSPETDYTVDTGAGTVTFSTAPSYPQPFFPNTVKISYSKANEAAKNAVMDCPYAAVYGGDQNLCIVLGGCEAQPNAYFWNGNHAAMDPGYWPMDQYNLAGDANEKICGFGRQQGLLVIFKDSSVGKADFGTVKTGTERLQIQMPYTAINSRTGCDLPWSIQLIENNLVFCSSKQGVHMILDSSSANENNIVQLSRKVDGSEARPGLLHDARAAGADGVCSFDDDECYWLAANGHVYAWDYNLSRYRQPSWFLYTNFAPAAFFRDDEGKIFHMDGQGRLTVLEDVFSDYGQGIEKTFRFATQSMGGFDRLKDVRAVMFSIRSDTDSMTQLCYETDCGSRYDLTPLRSFSWRLSPRNLLYRNLSVQRFAHVERRMPGCRNVRHFTMRLENSEAGHDLSLLRAQIQFTFQSRSR